MIEHPPEQEETPDTAAFPSTMAEEDEALRSQSIPLGELTSMSDLIADAVHQMNNPLSNIRLATEVLMEEMEEILPGDSQHREFCTKRLANIIGEVDRARAVIRELGQLARRKSHAKESLDLQSLVERAVRSPGVQIDPDVKIGIEIGDNISIRGDNHLMTTAIANLTSDALHALGGKGRVVFQARPEQDGAVEVTVTVSGTRIPGGDRDEISSPPLFTGKGGKRMGLRLAIACEIIKSQGGRIWAEHARGKGNTFRLSLPAPESEE